MPATASTPMWSRASISAISRMPPATISRRLVSCRKRSSNLERKPLHRSLFIDMGVEERAAEWFQLGDRFLRSKTHPLSPTLDRDSSLFGVDAAYDALAAHRGTERGRKVGIDEVGLVRVGRRIGAEQRRSDDHLFRTGRQDLARPSRWSRFHRPPGMEVVAISAR